MDIKLKESIYKYRVLITSIFLITIIISIAIFLFSQRQNESPIELINSEKGADYQSEEVSDKNVIYIDISGCVKNKGVYEMKISDRVKDVIEKAGGITEEADQDFVEKQLNMALPLTDGQKIYIPKKPENNSTSTTNISGVYDQKISINNASQVDLDSLSGIGEKRASSIIEGRPYSKIEDLVLRKIIPQSVFDEIKNDISL